MKTVAKLLEILAKEDRPFSELVAELPVYYQEKLKIECPDDEKEEVMSKIAEEIKTVADKATK